MAKNKRETKSPKKSKTDKTNTGLIFHQYIARYSYTTAIEVMVYETREQMKEAAINHPHYGGMASCSDFDACFAKGKDSHIKTSHETDKGLLYDVIGGIFLNKENLTHTHIMHECMHAALNWYNRYVRCIMILGKGGEMEELVVSTADEFYENILKVLKHYKLEVRYPGDTDEDISAIVIKLQS